MLDSAIVFRLNPHVGLDQLSAKWRLFPKLALWPTIQDRSPPGMIRPNQTHPSVPAVASSAPSAITGTIMAR